MRQILLLLGGMLLVMACTESAETSTATDAPDDGDSLAVMAPWARVAPEGGTSAVYFGIVNNTAAADTLLGVESEVANLTEVHESYVAEEGMRAMRPVPTLPVPAGAAVALEPGGYHVMLIQLHEALAEGDTVTVDLMFAQAGAQTLRVPVRATAP